MISNSGIRPDQIQLETLAHSAHAHLQLLYGYGNHAAGYKPISILFDVLN